MSIGIFENIFGVDKDTIKKKLSKNNKLGTSTIIADIFGTSKKQLEKKESTDDYLKKRGFFDLFKNSNPESKEDFRKVLLHSEHQLKTTLTKDNIFRNKPKGIVRSKFSEESITTLMNYIRLQNKTVPEQKIIRLGIDLSKDIYFEKNTFGKFDYNIVSYDTEADEYGETVLNTAVNWTTKRIVINWKDETDSVNYYKTEDGWDVILLYSANLWDACLLADIESLYSCILLSAMHEGHEELVSVYKKVCKLTLRIDIHVLEAIIKNERRSFWIPHNNGYDIPKLNSIHKLSRGKRNPFSVIKPFELEFIKIRTTSQELYSIKMGNIAPSFRFSANSDRRFSYIGLPRHLLAPKQADSYSLIFGVDTLVLAKANQQSGKLIDLSKGLAYEKIKLESEKIFKKEHMYIAEDGSITDELRYNIMDSLATIAVFGKLTVESDLTEIFKLLDIPEETELYPPIAKIISTTTKSKKTLLSYISKETKMSKDEILSNFETTRKYFGNYAKTYAGAASDCEVAGLIESDNTGITVELIEESWNHYFRTKDFNWFAKQVEMILYLDFRSQYPHASWLVNAMKKFILSAKGILQHYKNNNLDEIVDDFFYACQKRIDNPYQPFSKDFFKEFDGTATVILNKSLRFRRKYKNRYTEVIIKQGSQVTYPLMDIAFAVIDYSHKHHQSIHIEALIKFVKAERLDLDAVEVYGAELFTKLFLLRKEKEKEFGKHHHIPQTIKIMLNTIYGITAEGTSKDYYGLFLNYPISNPITALSRFLTRYAKLLFELNGSLNLNNDTDGLTVKSTIEIAEKVRHVYNRIMPLEYEEDTSFKSVELEEKDGTGANITINMQWIKKGFFLGKKKYALSFLNTKKEMQIIAKKHAIGQHSGEKDNVDDTFRLMYRGLLDQKPIPDIVNEALPNFKFWAQVTYKKDTDVKIIAIKRLLDPKYKIYQTTFYHQNLNLPISIYKSPESRHYVCNDCKKNAEVIDILRKSKLNIKRFYKLTKCCQTKYTIKKTENKYLVTNIKRMSKGSFGSFYIHQNIYFFIVADIKDHFFRLCSDILKELEDFEFIPAKTIYKDVEYSYSDLWTQLPKVRAKISRLLQFNQDSFSMDIKRDYGVYKTMKPITMLKRVKDTPIDVTVNTSKPIDVDGWNVTGFCSLPRMDFSADLLAYQSKYYSQSILMFSYIFSKFYLEKRHCNKDILDAKLESLLNKDAAEYPIPKDKKAVVVPFKITRFFSPDEIQNGMSIPASEIMMCLSEQDIEKYIDKECFTHDISTNTYFIIDNKRLLQKSEKIKDKAFWHSQMGEKDMKWMGRHFAFEIISKNRDPTNYNASLSINILVGGHSKERTLDKFTFKANLRINPTSRGMYNLDLLKTSIKEMSDNAWIIKKLLRKAIDEYKNADNQEMILKFFSNRTSATIDDLEQKQDKNYLHKCQYLLLCFSALKDSLKFLRYNLKTIAITKNIETNLNSNQLYALQTYLYKLFDQTKSKYIYGDKNPRTIAKKIRQLKINKHSASDGFTINNFYNNSALSMYIKNRKQWISKLSRVTLGSFAQLVKIIERSKHIKFKENILRIELTIFDFKALLEDKYYSLFDDTIEFIKETIGWMETENLDPERSQLSRFAFDFGKEADTLLATWFRVEDIDSEHEKWLKVLDNG